MKLARLPLAVVVLTLLAACGGDDDRTDAGPAPADAGVISLDSGPGTDAGDATCNSCFPSCTEPMSMNVGCTSDFGADCSACVPPCDVWETFFKGLDLEPYCNVSMNPQCVNIEMFDDTGPYYLKPSIPNCVPR